MLNCDYCGKMMNKSNIKHTNICQNKPNHIFCSKTCKNKWCFDIQKGKLAPGN